MFAVSILAPDIAEQSGISSSSSSVIFSFSFLAICDSADCVSIRQHTSAYVSIRQHTSAYVNIRQHMSAYVSIRQHTSAYVSIQHR
jgi:hypothetical protein